MIALNPDLIRQMLPMRKRNAHKGTYGTLTILAGSSRYRGAAYLAAIGALRAGVGIARLASTEEVCAAVAAQLPCCTFWPLPKNAQGGIAPEELPALLQNPTNALLAGCGLGNTEHTARLVSVLLEQACCPLVLDADALNVLAGHMDTGPSENWRNTLLPQLKQAGVALVLTPHIGEMARLCSVQTADVQAAPEDYATRFAAEYGCVVVLKNHATLVAAPNGALWMLAQDGNPGLAKGGSGDVLAGVIAALAAQGIAPQHAAAAGVWLHARAGALAAQCYGEAGMLPQDLGIYLAKALKELNR